METKLKQIAQEILGGAGITINGNNPWDIQVHDERFYRRILTQGSLGLGESYIDGWWDCKQLDEFFHRILINKIDKKAQKLLSLSAKISIAKVFVEGWLVNRQSISKSKKVGKQHYDVGNDLFELMLDSRMQYSCGYWKNAENLDKAQLNKLDLICGKIGLKLNKTILDIGCGWGGFLKFAAKQYKIRGLGVTISKEQARYGQENSKGLAVEIRNQDYREVKGKFDRIVSVGMFEHVGRKNYRKYMKKINSCLKDNGLFLLHTIGKNISTFSSEPFIAKYIFPGGELPSLAQITKSIEGLFIIKDVHNLAGDYDKTLMAWHKNFQNNWDKIRELEGGKYNNRFKRMWEYYIQSCAGSFRSGNIQLWQIVLSKQGYNVDYQSIR